MRRERRQPTRSEWERISSSRLVVRRILCPGARAQTPQTSPVLGGMQRFGCARSRPSSPRSTEPRRRRSSRTRGEGGR